MKRLVAVLVLALGVPAIVAAAPDRSFQWGPQDGFIIYNLDGNIPGAVNPTRCAWNDQDTARLLGKGSVEGTVEGHLCLIADRKDWPQYPKTIRFRVTSPAETLNVRLVNQFGGSWTTSSKPWRNDRVWELCIEDPVARGLEGDVSALPLVDGANGGRGIAVDYTLEVDNVGRRASKIVAQFVIAYAQTGIGPWFPLDDIPCNRGGTP